MARRIPLLSRSLNLALFGALLGAQDHAAARRHHRPEKLRYQPRRHRRPQDDPGR